MASPELAPGRRQRKKQRTRDALIEAAMGHFAAKGYDRTAVHEITDAVDVSERTFFRYFASKEDLVLSLCPSAQPCSASRSASSCCCPGSAASGGTWSLAGIRRSSRTPCRSPMTRTRRTSCSSATSSVRSRRPAPWCSTGTTARTGWRRSRRCRPVLANLRNLAVAEIRAATDGLTWLPNKRAVTDALKRMFAQASMTASPLGLLVLVLDLDHFKQINDQRGHPRGRPGAGERGRKSL